MLPAATALLALIPVLGPQGPLDAPLADRVPAIAERSVWRFEGGPETPVEQRGAFAIGNGHVFAAAGLTSPACSLTGLVGPSLSVAGDGSGPIRLELHDADGPVELPRQRVERSLAANFVVTEDASDQLAVRVTWFAPPGEARILAAIDIEARGDTPSGPLRLMVRGDRGADLLSGNRIRIALPPPGSSATRPSSGVSTQPQPLVPVASFEGLEPDRPWQGVVQISLQQPAAEPPTRDELETLAIATSDWWRERLAHTSTYDSDHAHLRDLLRAGPIDVLAQTSARTGLVVPMLGSRIATVRGQNGPMLTFLRYRMWDDARRILDAWWNVARSGKAIPVEIALPDVPSGDVADLDPAAWNELDVPPGDVGSWIVLQHFWYWRATRDTALIEERWPLIEACVKRQVRREDVLIPFAGDEPWVFDLGALPREMLGPDPELIGEDPRRGRRAESFASSVAFLMAVHALGDMLDGIDRARHPEAWAGEAPEDSPGSGYVRRAFRLMSAIEQRYWQEDLGRFAPARSPVNGALHRPPVANAALLPLWVGWTFPSGERSRDNLRHTLESLWVDGARIGTTRTLGVATGDLQGLLLTALAERDGARRLDALAALLDSAAPAGEWSSFHGPDGRPVAGARLDPAVLGINLDAILFAVTGIRQAAYARWDDDDIRLELRLPHGATWFSARGAAKDGRVLDLFFREEVGMLTEEERRANDELAPDRRRDPDQPHRRLKFLVELVEGEPPRGYYDVAINAEGTVFVRYLQPHAPAAADQPDLRRIDETVFETPDTHVFLPERSGAAAPTPPREIEVAGDARRLALTCRRTAAEVLAGPGVTLFDTALPFDPARLGALLLDDGQPRHAELYLDWGHAAPPPAGWNGGWFTSDAWRELLERYRAAGGHVLEPGFIRRAELDGDTVEAAADGAFELPGGNEPITLELTIDATESREAVLRLGANAAVTASLDGEMCARGDGERFAEPDRVAGLVRLAAGANVIRIRVEPAPEGRPRRLFVRLSDAQGLPLR